jgi:hypothetical protein
MALALGLKMLAADTAPKAARSSRRESIECPSFDSTFYGSFPGAEQEKGFGASEVTLVMLRGWRRLKRFCLVTEEV